MYINGTWLPNEVAETTPDDFKWGAFAFPEVPNGVEGTECGCYSTYAIAVNKDCDDAATQAAVEFIVYLTTSEWDQEFTNQANAIPMNVDHVWPENLADAQVVLNSSFSDCYHHQQRQQADHCRCLPEADGWLDLRRRVHQDGKRILNQLFLQKGRRFTAFLPFCIMKGK